ncbi:MAG: hypothetical protein ACREVB_11995, partial [Burkholderiales bacterium]
TTGITRIEQVMQKELVVASTGRSSGSYYYPAALNAWAGTKFKVVLGYQGGNTIQLAMERGEVDGRCGWGWSSLNSTRPDWVRDKKVNYLLQLALEKNPKVDAPLIVDLVKDEAARQMMTLLFGPLSLNKPFFGPPGMPTERRAELRKAFAQALNDKELRAEAIKIIGEDLKPTGGEQAQKLLAAMYATPPAVVTRLKGILAK